MKKIRYYLGRIKNMSFKEFFKTIGKIHQRSGKSRIYLFFDMLYCSYKYLAGYTDYFLFYFEDLPNEKRKTYITRGVNNGYLKTLNNPEYYHFFRNKIEFNQKFKEFVNRDFLDLRKTNLEKFTKFVKKHNVIMVKPVDQSGGANVEKIVIDPQTNIAKLYEVLKSDLNDATKYALAKSWDQVFSLNLTVQKEITEDLEKHILEQIAKRNEAKANKDYALADKIRDDLLKEHVILKDTREGTTYTIE